MSSIDVMHNNWQSGTDCHAAMDGDCSWAECPQLADGEPKATGRHCPLDQGPDDD